MVAQKQLLNQKNKMKKKIEHNFETKLKRLEVIVQKLEDGSVSLDESIQLFEEGMNISTECYEYLNNAEKKVKQLIKNQDGKIQLADFE